MLNTSWRGLLAGVAMAALMSGQAMAEAGDATASDPGASETVEGPVDDGGMVSIDFGLEPGGEVVDGDEGTVDEGTVDEGTGEDVAGEDVPGDDVLGDPQVRGPEDCENCRGDDGVTDDGVTDDGSVTEGEDGVTDDPDMEVTAYDGEDVQTLSDVPEAMQSGIGQPRDGKGGSLGTSFSRDGNAGSRCTLQRHAARCLN